MKKHVQKFLIFAIILALVVTSVLLIPKNSNTVKAKGITVHFKWEEDTPHLYYENVNGEENTPISYPGVPMNQEENGWYSYTIQEAESADIIFVVPAKDFQTVSLSREEGEWWFDEGTWYAVNPDSGSTSASVTEKDGNTSKSKDDVVQVDYREASTVNAEAEEITIHFVSDWTSANIYYWNSLPKNEEVNWPGNRMEKDSSGYYTYTFKGLSKVNFLFNNGTEQTEDLTLNKAGEWWYKNGKWTDYDPANEPPISTPIPIERTDFRDETIYFLITTRFYDGDSGNNVHNSGENSGTAANDPAWRGDFKGLIEKLDYIKALGFSAVWITNVVENRSALDYHGYHAYNFSKVDSRYLSDGVTYQDLINECHKKGIKVIQDVVFNHTCNWGEENLLQLTSDVYTERNQVVMNGKGDPENIYHHNGFCGGADYDNYAAQNKTIADDCFDLETENPKVYNYLIECYNNYINMGVDAFRVDTVKHISRLTLNSVFVPAFKKTGGDQFYMFGEVCTKGHDVWYRGAPPISTSFYTWADNSSWLNKWSNSLSSNESLVENHYEEHMDMGSQPTSDNAFLNGNEYHKVDYSKRSGMDVIDFQMHWSFNSASGAFQTALGGDRYFNDSTWNVVYVDSHDYSPDECQTLRYTGGTEAWAENLNLMFTFRGIPCLYYGSEIEFQKGKPIDVGGNAPLAETGRAYFGDKIEGSVNTTDFGVYSNATGTMAETLNYPLAKHIQRLNLIRRAVPALRKGQYSTEGVSGGMAFKRRYTEGSTDSFVCVSISGDATFTGVPSGTYVDMISGKSIQCNGTLSINVSGKGNMGVYVLQTAGAPSGKIGEDGTYLK